MGWDGTAGKKRRTSNPKTGASSVRFDDSKFVNYELDAIQQKACKEHEVTEVLVFSQLDELCGDGYSFGVRLDRDGVTFASFMQFRGDSGINAGLILSGRGSSPFKALKQVLYKHYVCLDGDWRPFAEHGSGVSIDD